MQEAMLPIEVEAGETVELVLPFVPKSKNEYENMPFLHRRGYRAKWWRKLTETIPSLGLGHPQAVEVEIVVVFASKRARDWQNYAYPLIHDVADALVKCGVIPDDTPARFKVGPNGGLRFEVDGNRLLASAQRKRTILRFTPID
jgi:hypothetical protein